MAIGIKNATFAAWDIEAVENVFSIAIFYEHEARTELYFIADNLDELTDSMPFETLSEKIKDKIFEVVPRFKILTNGDKRKIAVLNLCVPANLKRFAKTIGYCEDYDILKSEKNTFFADIDPHFNPEKHPFFVGYNSFNYDLTMIAQFLYDAYHTVTDNQEIEMPTAKTMHDFNNALFDTFKKNMPSALYQKYDFGKREFEKDTDYTRSNIRRNMLRSGRHLDLAKLNEKQSFLALKRLLAMLGYQIKEPNVSFSATTRIKDLDELLDLLAYNVSDVVYTAILLENDVYKSNFELKRSHIEQYPDLLYEKEKAHTLQNVRFDRMTIDSTSAQLVENTLCPYGNLSDIEAVSYLYPSKEEAEKTGLPQRNILEETLNYVKSCNPTENTLKAFMAIYDYYKSIEGQNFNDSLEYAEKFGTDKPVRNFDEFILPNMNMPYFDSENHSTGCIAVFGKGGIHGQEYNLKKYRDDARDAKIFEEILKLALPFVTGKLIKEVPKELEVNGRTIPRKEILKAQSPVSAPAVLKKPKTVELTENKNGSYKLNKKYRKTSVGLMNHDDFKSYYPILLKMMNAFFNEMLGEDRYLIAYNLKEEYGHKLKDPNLTPEEKATYKLLRGGVKLILNSATGAGDTKTRPSGKSSKIRMNNKIISMRIIGQLITFRVGLALSQAGGKVYSTNTDGLYAVLEKETNDRIIAEISKEIGVEIEPEQLFLISKDTNNRCEFSNGDYETTKLLSVSGGDLQCYYGMNPYCAPVQPAIVDYTLVEYMKYKTMHDKDLNLESEFEPELAERIMRDLINGDFTPQKKLWMFQYVLASSPSSNSYIFGKTADGSIVQLQHYNRAFAVNKTEASMNISTATMSKITPATAKKREKNNERAIQNDPLAEEILSRYGVNTNMTGHEAIIKKATNVNETVDFVINNTDLWLMDDESAKRALESLNLKAYIDIVEKKYTDSWRNA